jgi:hypothetical protein
MTRVETSAQAVGRHADGAADCGTLGTPTRVAVPMLKSTCTAELRQNAVVIHNGPFDLCLSAQHRPATGALRRLVERSPDPTAMISTLEVLLGCDRDGACRALELLTRAGVVVEHPAARPALLDGAYVAYRLIDHYRIEARRLWLDHDLFGALLEPAARAVAVGLLLETYFVVRNANWTSVAVLAQAMTRRQRQLLEDFFIEERGHAADLAAALTSLGFEVDALEIAHPAAQTLLYNQFFYTAGHRSTDHFAVGLIIPEVRLMPPGAVHSAGQPPEVIDRIAEVHRLPRRVIDAFRAHSDVDLDAGHGELPVQLLAEHGCLVREWVDDLAMTLQLGMQAFAVFLDGVMRRYASGGCGLATGPVVEV